MKTKFFSAIALIAITLLSSCGSSKESKIDGVPFQAKEDGKWGMLAPDGSVIFESEFSHENTVYASRNERFVVSKEKDGEETYQIYTLDEKPQEVGKTYHAILPFWEDVTVAKTTKDKIVLIDKDGNEITKLDKIGGKEVLTIRTFQEGLAAYCVEKNDKKLWGFINTKGESVIDPKYCYVGDFHEGKTLAVPSKYADSDREETTISAINTKGEELFTIKGSKYYLGQGIFQDGLLVVCTEKDNEKSKFGLMNDEGEVVFNPTNKIKNIHEIKDGKFIYSDGDDWGLMNVDGEKLIKAKYEKLLFANDDLLIAVSEDKDDEVECELIDFEGNKITKDTYKSMCIALDDPTFGSQHFFVQDGEHSWTVIDESGEEVKDITNIYDIYGGESGYMIQSENEEANYYDEYEDDYNEYEDVDTVAYDEDYYDRYVE